MIFVMPIGSRTGGVRAGITDTMGASPELSEVGGISHETKASSLPTSASMVISAGQNISGCSVSMKQNYAGYMKVSLKLYFV